MSVPPPPPGWVPAPPAGWQPTPPKHTARNLAIIVVVVVIVVVAILALAVEPAPHLFSTSLHTGAFNAPVWQLDPPAGSPVTGKFSTESGDTVTFGIVSAGGQPVYSADAASGSFSFSATDSPYTFSAYSIVPETVQIAGSYSAPLG